MTEKTIDSHQIHTVGRSDFEFTDESNYIISVGNDCTLKKINFRTKEVQLTEDLQDAAYTVAINSTEPNKIFIGGETTRVECFEDFELDKPFPIMVFGNAVNKISISSDYSYIAACTNETGIFVYSTNLNKTYKPKPGHDSSVLHIGFNSTSKYVASTGCEGTLNIYSIPMMEENPITCKVKNTKLGRETRLETEQIYQFDWHPYENTIACPGNFNLQLLRENGDGSWAYFIDTGIRHIKDISAVKWNHDAKRLLTFCVDKVFKLWNYPNKEVLQHGNYNEAILCIKYSLTDKVFGFMSTNGSFGVWNEHEKESAKKELLSDYKSSSKKKITKAESDYDENDLSELDRLMEEDRSGIKKHDTVIKASEMIPEVNPIEESAESEQPKPEEPEEEPEPEHEPVQEHNQNSNSERILDKKPLKIKSLDFDKDLIRGAHADILDFAPQNILYPSSTNLNKNRRFLCWNLTGTITLRNDSDFASVEIEFINKNFHANILIKDNYGICMGTVNEKGIILASRFEELYEDEYEDELKDENKKYSNLIFRPLNFQVEEKKEWRITLPPGENCDAVALGNNWIAAITDINMVRLFNFKGVETKFFCLERPLVAAAGYENLLAIVYHESPPFMKCQCLKLKVFDVEKEKVIYNEACPISPNTTLIWFGFSDTGMIFTQDSRGIIRGLPAFKQWHVLYRPKDEKKNSRFWMIGVHEYNFIGCVLERDEIEPSTYSRPPVKSMKIHTPFLDENNYYAPKNAEIIKKNIILDHERFRSENWLELKLSREKTDNFYSYSENILDKHEIQGAADNVEKSVVELFQECLSNQDLEKAYILATYLKTVKSLNICLYICNKANMMNLVPKIQALLDAKKTISKIQEYQSEHKGISNEIVIMKGSQFDPILEHRKKKTGGLASHAVQLPNQKQKTDVNRAGSTESQNLREKFTSTSSTEDAVDGILSNLHSEKPSTKQETVIRETKPSTQTQPQSQSPVPNPMFGLGSKKKSIFDEFSDKNMGSNSKGKRKADAPIQREDIKKVKEGTK